jgi:hypothetical protein
MAQSDSIPTDPVDVPSDGLSQFSYSDGVLTTSTGQQLHDVDVIAVVDIEGNGDGYKVLSFAPPEAEAETGQETKPRPFELVVTQANSLPGDFLEKHHMKGLPTHLEPSHELRVIVSTLSGTGLANGFYDEVLGAILQTLSINESRYTVVQTEHTQSILNLAETILAGNANEGKEQTVIVLSGDGGVVDIINGLLESGDRSRYGLRAYKKSTTLICG